MLSYHIVLAVGWSSQSRRQSAKWSRCSPRLQHYISQRGKQPIAMYTCIIIIAAGSSTNLIYKPFNSVNLNLIHENTCLGWFTKRTLQSWCQQCLSLFELALPINIFIRNSLISSFKSTAVYCTLNQSINAKIISIRYQFSNSNRPIHHAR